MTETPNPCPENDSGELRQNQDFLTIVYNELRKLAAQKIANERPGQTLQATALVHEAYLRLEGRGGQHCWQSRGHFFSAAAEAMQRILVESARRKKRLKHGGDFLILGQDQLSLADPESEDSEVGDQILQLNEALVRLERNDPQASQVVRLRYFAGLSIQDAAEILEISPRSVDRLWSYARAWLKREIDKLTDD